MRGGTPRRFACLAGALAALLCAAPANAQQPRIYGGSPADEREYPAQGYLELTASGDTYVCGGSLVSNRLFLTAAHCATELDTTTPLPASAFTVWLGKADKNDLESADRYTVTANAVDPDFAYTGPGNSIPNNDAALLTLATPAPARLEPLRLVETGETGLWSPGDPATIIGWGTTEGGDLSDRLLEATVPMVTDAFCKQVWGSRFSAAAMVCAGGGDTDTCGGDSGGPLMVSDGAFLILAGLTSWGANSCATPDTPGVYTRLGAPALNSWVRSRVPMARATVSDAAVDPDETVTFSVTADHPGVPGYFTGFEWDFDSDGTPDESSGPTVTHAYPANGRYVARVRATGAGPDIATDKVAIQVGPAPTPAPTPEPTPAPTAEPTAQPTAGPTPAPGPVPIPVTPRAGTASGPLATILAARRPKVSNGRFNVRVRFARAAPAGTAVLEVIRSRRTIGIARVRVLRGGTRRVRVKLTPSGRRLLVRSQTRRLTLKLRVRVGRRVLRSKTLTVRR